IDGPATSKAGTAVTFNASIIGAAPTGTVQFLNDGAKLSSPVVAVAANEALSKASVTTSSLAVGSRSIGAVYSGDAQNTWGPVTEVVPIVHRVDAAVAGSTVRLAGPASSRLGATVVLEATVTGNAPTGPVQ